MKLTFFGAAKAVTGSCHCVEVCGKKILVDCGLQQGKDERDNSVLDFAPNYIDYVIVTHAHIDHSGRVPLLIKQGFQGQIFTTRLTGQLLDIMLQDSAHIQEMEAQYKNQKGQRAGREPVEPLYTVADAVQVAERLVTVEYDEIIELFEGCKIRFVDAGHLLGSACVEMWLNEDGVEKKILFSGDLGNLNQPIIRDPSFVDGADYVVMESTYGDRNHEPVDSYTGALAKIIDETFARGGNVIIPSFAVGRTQELLYFMREMKKQNLVKSDPDFTVVVDSPLANEATKIFAGDLRGYLDDDAIKLVQEGEHLFTFPGLTLTESSEESFGFTMMLAPYVFSSWFTLSPTSHMTFSMPVARDAPRAIVNAISSIFPFWWNSTPRIILNSMFPILLDERPFLTEPVLFFSGLPAARLFSFRLYRNSFSPAYRNSFSPASRSSMAKTRFPPSTS